MSFNYYLEKKYSNSINLGFDTLNKDTTDTYGINKVPLLLTLQNINDVSYFIENGLKFIYPVPTIGNDIFLKEPPLLSFEVRNACKRGICRVVIFYDTEGNIYKDFYLHWLENFAILNELDPTNLFFSHGNRILGEIYTKFLKDQYKLDPTTRTVTPKFSILIYSYFETFPWFLKGEYKVRYSMIEEQVNNHLNSILQDNKENKKTKHFLCLNRRPRVPRVVLFGTICTNPVINKNTYITMGPHMFPEGVEFRPIVHIRTLLPKKVAEYIDNYNFKKPVHIIDNFNNNNEANGINERLHKSCFLNIVTETLDEKEIIFLSEKIFKPIYMLQPFIVVGNPNTLKELRKMGYRTFNKWWDESYDEEEDLLKRILKIETLLEKLSKLSYEELYTLTQEMEETLIHNYKRFLIAPKPEAIEYYKLLTFEN